MSHTLPASFIEGTCPPSEDRVRTRGAFAREKHFLFQEEDPQVTKQVDEGGWSRTLSLH